MTTSNIYYLIGTRPEMDKLAARRMSDSMIRNPSAQFGYATGNSVKDGFYPNILENLDGQPNTLFEEFLTSNLDETDWLGHKYLMKRSDPRTFRGFMDQHLLTGLQRYGFKLPNALFPSDFLPQGECFKVGTSLSGYDERILQRGGVHTWVVGFGQGRPDDEQAAHVAFCEPEHFIGNTGNWWEQGSYVAKLATKTRHDNAGYKGCNNNWQKVPNMAITVGPGTLLKCINNELIILVYGEKKAWPSFGALEGEVRPGCPASVVQLIGQKPGVKVYVYLDHAAAQHLKNKDRVIYGSLAA